MPTGDDEVQAASSGERGDTVTARDARRGLAWGPAAIGWVLLGLLAASEPELVHAQGSEDVNAGQFDFSLPGARSLGMGGAFIALADDATSAYSNPAGLIQLGRPEVSLEYRGWDFEATAIDRGHAFGQPTGRGLDTVSGVVYDSFPSRTSGISFASLVYPRSKWAFGLFGHQFPQFETSKDIQGAFFNCSGGYLETDTMPFCQRLVERTGGIDRVQPKEQEIRIGLWSAGATLSYRITPSLSVGLSGLYYSFSIDSVNRVFSTAAPDDLYGPKNTARLDVVSTQKGDDDAFALNGGFRWSLRSWTLAGAYRKGPAFHYDSSIVAGPAHREACPAGVCSQQTVRFKVPDTFAVGLAFRPTPAWTVTLQYDFVEFSDFLEQGQTSALQGNAERVLNEGLKLDDAHRFRFGFEYLRVFAGSQVLALRGGVWHDSAHRAYFNADPDSGLPYPQYALLFPRGSGQTHGSAGVGFVVQPHFQVDAAIDFSELYRTISVSTIWKF
jgi:opacity protein-like surface antigen